MPDITVTIPDDIFKILTWDIYEVREWLQNDISEKVRHSIDGIIRCHSALNPNRLSVSQKIELIKKMKLETAKERTDRMEEELAKERQKL